MYNLNDLGEISKFSFGSGILSVFLRFRGFIVLYKISLYCKQQTVNYRLGKNEEETEKKTREVKKFK